MKKKEEIIEWLRSKSVLNKFMRNMHYYYPSKTFDELVNTKPNDIFMDAFCWCSCNAHFGEDTDWCVLSIDYMRWYNIE